MAERTVAVHQPNFFPWLGFFDKLARADVFVLLDDVQYPRRSFTNRVRILVDGEPAWVTAPIQRAAREAAISEIRFDDSEPWRERILKTIYHSYRQASHFDKVFPRIEALVLEPGEWLWAFNEGAIRALRGDLGLERTELTLSSSLGVEAKATERIVQIVSKLGGDAYLSGEGAGGYQEADPYADAGIELIYQDFEPRAYPQVGTESHTGGLSVIDSLMSCGFEGTRELLER